MYVETEVFVLNVTYPKEGERLQDDVIELEENPQIPIVAEISLRGRYNQKMKIYSDWTNVRKRNFLVDKNLLLMCLSCDFIVFDLDAREIIFRKELDSWSEDVIKLGDGYFVHTELDNYYFDKDFNIVWSDSCGDMFENTNVEDNIEIGKNYVAVYDWFGTKHYYNSNGEFKTEQNKHLAMR